MGENENQIATVRTPSVEELANVSHQRGSVQMITITKDKIEAVLSAGNSLFLNFFMLVAGIAVAILTALKSGGVEESSKPVFWLAFCFSLILVLFFGIGACISELKKRKLRQELLSPPDNASRGRGEGTG